MLTRESVFQEILDKVKWDGIAGFPSFLNYENQKVLDELISKGRSSRVFIDNDLGVLKSLLSTGADSFRNYKEHIRNQPRRDAQAFIGKKKIRTWLFNRDRWRCLSCASSKHLQVDHIVPVGKGGENRLSNLQTLCRSCNSRKSDTYKDYRI
jgi:5-methylcytosine-specific restriction protein A